MSWVQAAAFGRGRPLIDFAAELQQPVRAKGAFNQQSTYALATPILPLRNAGELAHGTASAQAESLS